MKVDIIGKKHIVSKAGKDVYIVNIAYEQKDTEGKAIATCFTNRAVYDGVKYLDSCDMAVFFNENGFNKLYFKKGEK